MKLFSEAIKLKDGVFHNISYHQARMDRTTGRFFGKRIDLAAAISTIPAHAKRGLFKCRVLYGDTVRQVEFIPYVFRDIKTVAVVVDDEIDYSYKYADRNRLDMLARMTGTDDIIIVKNGLVTDASSSNLVFVRDGNFVTPADCLLPGTKRQLLLDKGMIRQEKVRVEDIWHYDSVLFINAMIDIEDGRGIVTDNIIPCRP